MKKSQRKSEEGALGSIRVISEFGHARLFGGFLFWSPEFESRPLLPTSHSLGRLAYLRFVLGLHLLRCHILKELDRGNASVARKSRTIGTPYFGIPCLLASCPLPLPLSF